MRKSRTRRGRFLTFAAGKPKRLMRNPLKGRGRLVRTRPLPAIVGEFLRSPESQWHCGTEAYRIDTKRANVVDSRARRSGA